MLFGKARELLKFIDSNSDKAVMGPIVACTPVETLGMVVTKLVDNGIHRVFAIRSKGSNESSLLGNVPMSVLSPKDILVELLRE